MEREPSVPLIEAVAVTSEICGTVLSKPAAKAMAVELARYDEEAILKALRRCISETPPRLSVAEVLKRVEDGRPSALQAWGMLVWDEDSPYTATDEMLIAQGECRELYFTGDKVGARMIFLESYSRECVKSRGDRKAVSWMESEPCRLRPFESREERDRAQEQKAIPMPEELKQLIAGAVKEIQS